MPDHREFLRSIDLLGTLLPAELDQFSEALVSTEFQPGQLILEEGQPNRALHLVREGRIRVTRKVDERELILCDLSAGRTFGELSILDEGTASATLRAVPRTVILSLSSGDLHKLLEESPATAAKFWKALALDLRRRLLHTNDVVRTYFEVNLALIENPTFLEAYAMVSQ